MDKRTRAYKQLAIEQKGSYKWIRPAEANQPFLQAGGATQVTYIGDCEADIYAEWSTIPTERMHWLIRAGQDQKIIPSLGNQVF